MGNERDGTDISSIRPVSSLRSRFENLSQGNEDSARPGGVLLLATGDHDERPRTSSGHAPSVVQEKNDVGAPVNTHLRKPTPGRSEPRPVSMWEVPPSQRSPSMVQDSTRSSHTPNGASNSPFALRKARQHSPLTDGRSKSQDQTQAPPKEVPEEVFHAPSHPPVIDMSTKPKPSQDTQSKSSSKVPPPVNRTAKPRVPSKPESLIQQLETLAPAGDSTARSSGDGASPFGTPPGSGSTSPVRRGVSQSRRERNLSDASFVERLRSDSGGSSMADRTRTNSDVSFVLRVRGDSDVSHPDQAGRFNARAGMDGPPGDHVAYANPSLHRQAIGRREQEHWAVSASTSNPALDRPQHARHFSVAGDLAADRPRLPARPELQTRSGRSSPTKSRSGRSSPSKLSQQIPAPSIPAIQKAATFPDPSPTTPIAHAAQTLRSSALSQGFDRKAQSLATKTAPAVPAPRRSTDGRRPQIPSHTQSQPSTAPDPAESSQEADMLQSSVVEYPDSSQSNRRPPRYKHRPWQIPTEYDTRLCAVCGEFVVTTGYITKAWNLKTGEQVLNMVHHENVKVSSLVFKPGGQLEPEGRRIWLGTNIGEIHEVDIPIQSLVKTKTGVHTRRDVTRMIRYASQIWSLDEGGELNVWQPDKSGQPNLDVPHSNFRTPRGHTYAIAVGGQLWLAFGKDIRVFNPGARADTEFQVLRSTLSQPNAGDVTSGATLSGKPDAVFFGHSDGKVSIYNCNDYTCSGVVSISLYKISSLAGVGDHLWAGYNTGMAYVYDTSTAPWRVRKDWQAHEKQVCTISVDPALLWTADRLQVVTLGTDNMIRLWDGFLEEDWLVDRMQQRDADYCAFRELTASVLTWNCGASKPNYLQHSEQDNRFLRDFLTSGKPSDIIVFGFQELVDLEDKRMTARTLLKGKRKDASEQEHMSHQYRAWRDHLTRCIEDFVPADQSYTLLHTATLVGLFTCLFVKTSERARIKHVHTAEVKRGIGGLHGNKGAIIMRFVLDDSSICFVNCHLAAGQTQTIHRNNDIAGILEATVLPTYPLNNANGAQHTDVFTGGGDGSMVLDHEICILSGDLNYRIDTTGRDTVIKHVQTNNLARLLERDQLLLSRRKNPGFRLRAFQESTITFAPTYKYNLHSDEYDTSEKRRPPAWCDRILYRGLGKVKMEEYRRWEVRVSDHRPVSGRLRLRVKTVDDSRREQASEVCRKEFEQFKRRVSRAVQAEYLANVQGMTVQEARAALG